jgi:hypothetical protein
VEAVRVQCQTKNGAGEKLTYTNLPVSFHIRTRFIFFSLSEILDIMSHQEKTTQLVWDSKIDNDKKEKV